MKIIVMSDSHGASFLVQRVVKLHNDADLFVFLGDGERDLPAVGERFPDLPFFAVRGNCDLRSALSSSMVCAIGGRRFFLCHGHLFQVKYEPGLDTLLSAGRQAGAEIILFGHTHLQLCEERNGVLLFNPGAVGRTAHPCYGVLTLEGGALRPELKTL